MKFIPVFILVFILFACAPQSGNEQVLQNRIDDLETKLANVYKPGLGEFMIGIQAHHAKLWQAGESQNWKLADFELNEIKESIDDIRKYETDRKETEKIMMITPALDSVNAAIRQNNLKLFKQSFVLLTNTCNNCHRSVEYEFNVIKVPDGQQFSNQEFKVSSQ